MRSQLAVLVLLTLPLAGCTDLYGGQATHGKLPTLAWVEETRIAPAGYTSPNVIALRNGTLALYTTADPAINATDRTAYVSLSFNGLVFSPPSKAIEGALHPNVVPTRDGYRMYFTRFSQEKGATEILSATSKDGLRFQLEPGARISPQGALESRGVRAPDIVPLSGGGWRMYYVASAPAPEGVGVGGVASRILSATREDGLAWTRDAGLRVDSLEAPLRGHADGPTAIKNGTHVRLYFWNVDGQILSAQAADGLTFGAATPAFGERTNPAAGRTRAVVEPTLLQLDEDCYRMFYAVPTQGIFSALGCPP